MSVIKASQIKLFRNSTLFFSEIYVGHMTTVCWEKQCYESQLVAHTLPQVTKISIKKFWYTNKTIEIRLGTSEMVIVTRYAKKT